MKKLISWMAALALLLSMLPACAAGTGLSYVLADQFSQAEAAQELPALILENVFRVLAGEKNYSMEWAADYNSSVAGENAAEQLQGAVSLGRTEDGALQLELSCNGVSELLYRQDRQGYRLTSAAANESGMLAELADVENLSAAQLRALMIAMFAEAENSAGASAFAQALLSDVFSDENLVGLLLNDGEFTAAELSELTQSALQNLTLDMETLNALSEMPVLEWIGVPESGRRMYIMKLFRRMGEMLAALPNQNETIVRLGQAENSMSIAVLLDWADSKIEFVLVEGEAARLQLNLSEALLSGLAIDAVLDVTESGGATQCAGSAAVYEAELGLLNAAVAGSSSGDANRQSTQIDLVAVGGEAMIDISVNIEEKFEDGGVQSVHIAEPTPEATEAPVALQINDPAQASVAVNSTEPPAQAEEPQLPEPVVVPFGETLTFDAQIAADGNARLYADDAAYETVSFTLGVNAHKDPAYFEENYSRRFNLTGTEAAVDFTLTLNGYTGAAQIIPQNIILVTMQAENGTTVAGYQLMDAEMAGNTGIAVQSGVPATLYKRYPWDESLPIKYLSVNAYIDGVPHTYLFELAAPPAQYETLSIGSVGTEVSALQAELIELGLLFGAPDGKFGNYTAEAVKIMQGRFGMEPTGVADPAFLAQLYS